MNLRQLRFFVAVYEEGSIRRAAERLNCAQPGISTQIRQLEESLGTVLFDRSVSGVIPTVSGREFYRHAVGILRAVEEARQRMDEIGGEISGTLRFGVIPSVLRAIMTTVFPDFVTRYPNVHLQMIEAYSVVLTDWVMADRLDFAVVIEPPEREGMTVERLSEERMMMVSGQRSERVPWEPADLRLGPPLKLVAPMLPNGLRLSLEKFIRSGDLPIERLIEMDSVHGSVAFVKSSEWSTILPATAVADEIDSDQLVFTPIAGPAIASDFYLIHQTQHPLAAPARLFCEGMRAELIRLDHRWRAALARTAA